MASTASSSTLNERDAAVTEYQPVLEQSCQEDFAIVGSGAVQDNFWPDVGAACGLIDIAGFSVTPDKAGVAGRDPIEARSVQPVPNPSDLYQVGSSPDHRRGVPRRRREQRRALRRPRDDPIQAERVQAGWEEIGHTIVHEAAYNILGESNWAPFAQALQDDGVQYLQFVGEGENFALMVQAMEEIGYRPDVIAQDANFYDQNWVDAAGAAADGVFVRTVFWPFEEADANPATQQYLDLVTAIDGKIAPARHAVDVGLAALRPAARDCDLENNLTRSCVLEGAAAVEDWTGGGLHAPTNPGSNEPPECTIVLRVEGGAFTRFAPDEGYDCGEDSDEPYVVPVDIG